MDRYPYLGTLYYLTSVYLRGIGALFKFFCIILYTLTKRLSPSRRAEELKRKDLESKSGGDGDSLLLNVELAAGAVSSILKDSDLDRSNVLPVDEALALSFQWVASVSSYVLSYIFPF